MKIALPVWGNRISPVFDTTTYVLYAVIKNAGVVNSEKINVESLTLFQRVELLRKLDLDLFICGGITQPTLNSIRAKNINILPFICGDVKQILDAVLKGKDIKSQFSMPGNISK